MALPAYEIMVLNTLNNFLQYKQTGKELNKGEILLYNQLLIVAQKESMMREEEIDWFRNLSDKDKETFYRDNDDEEPQNS